MPQFSYPIPDIYQMITRPVIVAIVKQIMDGTGIPASAFIEYKGEHGQTPTWRSFIDKSNPNTEDGFGKMPFIEKVQVEVDENPLEDFLLSTPYHYPDNKRVWHDPNLNITLSPFYERAEYSINFTYRTPDKGTATQWRSNMMRRIKVKFTDMSMIARYQIIIPHLILNFLKQFWTMREAIAGYDDTWSEYFLNHRLQKLVKLVDQAGNNPEIALDETQLDILGSFQFTDVPKEERQDDGSCYNISFSYKFRFDHPAGFVLKYPLTIHNQLVPQAFRPDKPHRYDPHAILGNSSQSMSRYDEIIQQVGGKKNTIVGGHLVPWFDDWSPDKGYHNTSPLLQLLCRIDADDPTNLMDLRQLEQAGLKMSDTTRQYMIDNYRDLNKHAACGVYFAVYVNDDVLDQREYYVTKDLVVRLRNTPDMRNFYHLVIFVINDLLALTPAAKKVLRYNPPMFKELVNTLDPDIDPDSIEVLAGKYIREFEYQRILTQINTSSKWYGRKHFLMRPTVLGAMVKNLKGVV
jgi:hypothetical protein